jgi:hypothetical protein
LRARGLGRGRREAGGRPSANRAGRLAAELTRGAASGSAACLTVDAHAATTAAGNRLARPVAVRPGAALDAAAAAVHRIVGEVDALIGATRSARCTGRGAPAPGVFGAAAASAAGRTAAAGAAGAGPASARRTRSGATRPGAAAARCARPRAGPARAARSAAAGAPVPPPRAGRPRAAAARSSTVVAAGRVSRRIQRPRLEDGAAAVGGRYYEAHEDERQERRTSHVGLPPLSKDLSILALGPPEVEETGRHCTFDRHLAAQLLEERAHLQALLGYGPRTPLTGALPRRGLYRSPSRMCHRPLRRRPLLPRSRRGRSPSCRRSRPSPRGPLCQAIAGSRVSRPERSSANPPPNSGSTPRTRCREC